MYIRCAYDVTLLYQYLIINIKKNIICYHITVSIYSISGWWFQPTPLKNMSSLVGMKFPTEWKNRNYVPNHQPAIDVECKPSRSAIPGPRLG